MRFVYRFGDAEYYFDPDRQCLVRADLYAAELLSKAADNGTEELAGLAAKMNLDRDQPPEVAVTWTPPQDEPEAKPAFVAPQPQPEPGAEVEQMIWDYENLGTPTTDDKVRLQVLRHTLSMIKSQDLGCHFLNFVESPNAI
jgi:hypothetical protein